MKTLAVGDLWQSDT